MPGMLTTTQAALLTRPPVTRFTVAREIGRGNLAAQKVGRQWAIDPEDAREWAQSFTAYGSMRRPRA